MTTTAFTLDLASALAIGLLLGLERQFGRHPAGLRTTALVCTGAALFVLLGRLMDNTDGRIAAQVVSGIGFLGGGAILREGLTVKGMTTAATLWCSAGLGSLAGSGYIAEAWIGAAAILATNIVLLPVSDWMDKHIKDRSVGEALYRFKAVCLATDEQLIRATLARGVNSHPNMILRGISIHNADQPGTVLIVADVYSTVHDERAVQDVVTRLNVEPSTTSVSWERSNGS
jgi:putative Mg2+ transporter-C (MgtC) family protein